VNPTDCDQVHFTWLPWSHIKLDRLSLWGHVFRHHVDDCRADSAACRIIQRVAQVEKQSNVRGRKRTRPSLLACGFQDSVLAALNILSPLRLEESGDLYTDHPIVSDNSEIGTVVVCNRAYLSVGFEMPKRFEEHALHLMVVLPIEIKWRSQIGSCVRLVAHVAFLNLRPWLPVQLSQGPVDGP
jgi:hypothetical protein